MRNYNQLYGASTSGTKFPAFPASQFIPLSPTPPLLSRAQKRRQLYRWGISHDSAQCIDCMGPPLLVSLHHSPMVFAHHMDRCGWRLEAIGWAVESERGVSPMWSGGREAVWKLPCPPTQRLNAFPTTKHHRWGILSISTSRSHITSHPGHYERLNE